MLYLSQGDDAPHLSSRERQVLERVALGRSAKEVAVELGIAHRTVERHIENARYKMRARNKTHMIAKAVICGELVLATATQDNDESGADEQGLLLGQPLM
ncbi:MAG TPA: helix-turn-helix transcriptional regulator [Sphingomicrobium sp.]|jgi:DNA-binding CsgD family transcriptional regulator